MIGLTVDQAAARVYTTPDTVWGWIKAGALIALRCHVDDRTYVDEQSLVDVERAYRVTGTTPVVHPGMMTIPLLSVWLTCRGYPTTERALRDWVEEGHLTATVPHRPGRGGTQARYDPVHALELRLIR